MTPPDSGEREVQHVVAAAFEYCRVDGEVAVHVPLPLAQRILAALEEAYGFVPMAGKELQALYKPCYLDAQASATKTPIDAQTSSIRTRTKSI